MNTTAWVLIASVFLYAAYDIYALSAWGYSGTISADIWQASQKNPIIPFAAGVLCGHLFWSQGSK